MIFATRTSSRFCLIGTIILHVLTVKRSSAEHHCNQNKVTNIAATAEWATGRAVAEWEGMTFFAKKKTEKETSDQNQKKVESGEDMSGMESVSNILANESKAGQAAK